MIAFRMYGIDASFYQATLQSPAYGLRQLISSWQNNYSMPCFIKYLWVRVTGRY